MLGRLVAIYNKDMSKRRSVDSSSCSYSSGSDTAFGETDPTSPNPESVRATLDMYVSAARDGREAYAKGDLRAAVQQFDQALALELQTELDCIYDPSIGMVSGLVRKEVTERLPTSPLHSPGNVHCNRIMQSLLRIYTDSEAKVRRKPTDPRLYLRMGAALCCANEWEKAKKIYMDGLSVCKDRKELKLALRRLSRMEQITTGREIPSEPYEPFSTTVRKSKSRTIPSLTSALRINRRKSASLEDMDFYSSTFDNRHRSSKSPSRVPVDEKPHAKPKARRVSSFGRLSRHKKLPEVDHKERESWSKVFQSEFCSEQVSLKPSAITQMRRLSVDFLDQSSDEETTSAKPTFAVVNFQSMKIESDDSELEDN